MNCPICIETFNDSSHKPVKCPFCNEQICRTCAQTYILQGITDIPTCPQPECKKPWSDDFLTEVFTRTWMNGAYRKYIAKRLIDKEKARLPDTQQCAAIYIDAKKTQLHKDPSNKCAIKNYGLLPHQVDEFGVPIPHPSQSSANAWTFVGKCPKTMCQGFVGLDYVCGLCSVKVCKDCMEPMTIAAHQCNPENVENIMAIRKEAKPCPKCAIIISKIDGCDQMWCTQCHTAFSWNTGAKETVIHNPHFYEWMRRTGQQIPARPQPQCWNVNSIWSRYETVVTTNANNVSYLPPHTASLNKSIRTNYDELISISKKVKYVTLEECCRLSSAIDFENTYNPEKTRILRVRRLANEITDEYWQVQLERMDHTNKKHHAFYDLYNLYKNTAIQLMFTFIEAIDLPVRTHESTVEAVSAILTQHKALTDYVNEHLTNTMKKYRCSVYIL